MKKRSKLRILSWITTIAMILSIFNIPLVGYATEGGSETVPNTEEPTYYYLEATVGYYVGDEYYSDIPINIEEDGGNAYVATCTVPNNYNDEKGIRIGIDECSENGGIFTGHLYGNIDSDDFDYAPIVWDGESGIMYFSFYDVNGEEQNVTVYIGFTEFEEGGEDEDDEYGDDEDEDYCWNCESDPCVCVEVEISYFLEDEDSTEKIERRTYGIENSAYIDLPYSYDESKGITVLAKYKDIESDEYVEEIFNIDVTRYGDYYFTLEDGREFNIEIYIYDEVSENTACNLLIEDECSEYDIYYDEMINDGEGPTTYVHTLRYGYDQARLSVFAEHIAAKVVYDEEQFESEEEFGLIDVSSGDVYREFSVIAENGDVEAFKVIFKASQGDSTDITANASYNVTYYHPIDEYYRSERVVFNDSEELDENDNPIAEGIVSVPRSYDGNGIDLYINSADIVYTTLITDDENEGNVDGVYNLGDIVEFKVTSANEENSKIYRISFVQESEEESVAVGLDEFTVSYRNAKGEVVTEDIDMSKASADGAVIEFDAETIVNNVNEYDDFYVDIYAKAGKKSDIFNSKINADSYNSDIDEECLNVSVDVESQAVASISFDVVNSNGYSKTYTVKLVNAPKATTADISELEIEYISINGESQWQYIYFNGNKTEAELEMLPFRTDEENPIRVTGFTADGTPINKEIYAEDFVNDKYELTIVSKAYMAKEGSDKPEQKEYKVTLLKATKPVTTICYTDKWGDQDYVDFTIEDDGIGSANIPYSSTDIYLEVMLLDGSYIYPELIWNEAEDKATAEFQDEKGITYKIEVERAKPSSDTEIYVELYVQYSEDEEDSNWFTYYAWQFNDENELTLTVPYGAYKASLYTDAFYSGNIQGDDTYIDELGPGVLNYTVTAEDGVTTKDYKINIAESTGYSTDAEINYDFEFGKNGFYRSELYFEKNKEGVMVSEVTLPYTYDEESGVSLYDNTIDKIVYEGDFDPVDEEYQIYPGRVYPSDENGWKFEFMVKSPNGEKEQKYRIDFQKENEEEAKVAEVDMIDLHFYTADKKAQSYEVDLTKEVNGNIEVHIPELHKKDGYLDIDIYSAGFGTIGNVSESDFGAGDYGCEFLGYEAKSVGEELVVKLNAVSSNGNNTKTYNLIIKTDKDTDNAHMANWDNGKTVASSCTKEGSTTYTCKHNGCGEKNVVTLPKLAHKYNKTVVAPTCTTAGYTTYKCTCGDTYTADETKALGHDYTAVVTSPTCTEEGYTTYTCKNDPTHKYVDNKVTATGHNFGEYAVVEKAGFDKEGKKEATCAGCQATESIAIAAAIVPTIKAQTFNNKNKTPSVTVTDADGNEISSTVKFDQKTRKAVGKYTAKITLTGENYSGTKTVSFVINPAGKSLSKVTAGKKAFTAKWSKPSSTIKRQMTGYELQYSTSSNMAKAKKVTVKGTSATSKTIKKLKSKKTYYVQLRTYKTVKGKKYYSDWSKTKKVKVK